ncbi:MAG: O-acetyl-ADP-ribose deacetylase [Bacteroidetes bacterium]|nr:O-acetyl-ADP-ribose deacetylase [Bacteroidota bacterium]
MKNRIEIQKGDITKLKVDAIVNAANTTLLGGGGVDGAIHRAAGPELLEECKALGGCPTGEAKITLGYQLLAKYVIHTAGPVWNGGTANEDNLLANCYKNSLKIATENGIKTIAFPAISTGVYRFPLERAVKIAINETKSFLQNNSIPEKVIFVCFDDKTFNIYEKFISKK